jgi:Trk K+ transport system NAD-binding subunit
VKTIVSQLAALTSFGRLRRRNAPFIRYIVALVAVILVYGWIFHVLMAREGQNHSWFTGIYWALTVMSTLGFGDITFTTDVGRAFSSLVLVSGIVLLLIILPFLFIRLVYAPWLEQQSLRRLRALQAVPADISDHVIVCADDPIALGLADRLHLNGIPCYVVVPDPVVASRMHDEGRQIIAGEVDAVSTFAAARVREARLVLANSTDTQNSNIVLTVRELTGTVPIAAIAESDDSIDILELSGATHVLPLKRRLGEHLAGRVSAGSARANVIGKFHDLLLAEFPVHETPFQGRTVRETNLREEIGITIVGVWERGVLHHATPDYRLQPSCVPVVIGTAEQIQELDEVLVIYDANPSPVLVIGGGKVGRSAADALKRREVPVHIVERSGDVASRIAGVADRVFIGDAADREVLEAAGVRAAPSILLTTHDDAMNVYLTVYCRRLNPEARILTRVTHDRNKEAILRAGSDFVLSYSSLGVEAVVSIVQGRDVMMLGEGMDLFHIVLPRSLDGHTLADAGIGARTGLNVIGVLQDGHVEANPPASRRLNRGCTLLALGTPHQRHAFLERYD